jgi:hypothetical protein
LSEHTEIENVHAGSCQPLASAIQSDWQQGAMNKSDKINEVARNAIWTEHCIREAKCLRMTEGFGGIRSPSKSVHLEDSCRSYNFANWKWQSFDPNAPTIEFEKHHAHKCLLQKHVNMT